MHLVAYQIANHFNCKNQIVDQLVGYIINIYVNLVTPMTGKEMVKQ